MHGFALLLPAFVAERAHQWQSLISRDWSVTWKGRRLPRGAVLTTILAVCWAEGLGFYVQSERAFWAMIFWVLAAHVVLTAALALRSSAVLVRRVGPVLILVSVLAAMLRAGSLDEHRPPSWLGHSLLPEVPGNTAIVLAAGASVLAIGLVFSYRSRSRGDLLLILTTGAAAVSGFVPSPALGSLVFVIAAHALPCFVRNVGRLPAPARLRASLAAVALATLEWWLVARSIWFPEGSLFPDLVDWWDLGHGANFLLHPLWMAPFLAHVVIDAIRFFPPPESPV